MAACRRREMDTKAKILAYGGDVLDALQAWWDGPGQTTDFSRKANVYYGDVTLHEYLERTTWHSGQHVRQLMMVLDMLGIEPDAPLGQGNLRRPADARQGLGRRAPHGVMLLTRPSPLAGRGSG